MSSKILPIFYRDDISLAYSKFDYLVLGSIFLLGTALRFWGLGNVGLYGDEETMAMPALKILESGLPLLPSGMFYPRAPGQLYLMASSIWIFGSSEWALRFPSAVAGSAGIIAAFFLGKRFLPPRWNILFVLIIALLPSLIATSQTARMYIFLSTFVMLFAVMVFRWEATGSWSTLTGALVVFLIALQFHRLAIFASLLFFFPLLTRPSNKRLKQAILAFVLSGAAFLAFDKWSALKYGKTFTEAIPVIEDKLSPFTIVLADHSWVSGAGLFSALVALFLALYFQQRKSRAFFSAILLFLGAAIAFAFLQYHTGVLLFACGLIFYVYSKGAKVPLLLLITAFGLLLTLQLYFLYQSELFPGRKIIGAVVGTPSIWPYLRFAEYFPAAITLYTILLVYAGTKLVKGFKIPDHYLFFVVSVWVPLLMIGFFKWYIPPRYTIGLVPFFVVACLAALRYLIIDCKPLMSILEAKWSSFLFVPFLIVVFINLPDLRANVNLDYARFPQSSGDRGVDHKGAASFMKTVPLHSGDVVIAEDVLQQTYYLGRVDYWLRSFEDANKGFLREKQGVLYDIYTATPLIGSGEQLSKLLDNDKRGAVYIIGSGETARNRPLFLGNGIFDAIQRYAPRVVYWGRDGQTVIWYFPPARVHTTVTPG